MKVPPAELRAPRQVFPGVVGEQDMAGLHCPRGLSWCTWRLMGPAAQRPLWAVGGPVQEQVTVTRAPCLLQARNDRSQRKSHLAGSQVRQELAHSVRT